MVKSITITVHPSGVEAEYLSVADALRQVLDYVEALDRIEEAQGHSGIVWRLTEAHTNSPPFTVTASAYPRNPSAAIDLEAGRVAALFANGVRELLDGERPDWMEPTLAAPFMRALRRNLNGVGRTRIELGDGEVIDVSPAAARTGIVALERAALDDEASVVDLRRTEYGSVECDVWSLKKWNNRPALEVVERLSQRRVTCVLTNDLADDLGPSHKWSEVWGGRRLLVSGALIYAEDGSLARVEAEAAREVITRNAPLSDLKHIDLLEGRSVSEHLRRLWGDDVV